MVQVTVLSGCCRGLAFGRQEVWKALGREYGVVGLARPKVVREGGQGARVGWW